MEAELFFCKYVHYVSEKNKFMYNKKGLYR